jgi:histidyl-tRNA synthetase
VKVASVKGMNDVLPTQHGEAASFDSKLWERVEAAARETCRRYGFDRIRTPIVEELQLFARGIGEATDIVGKEMYTFADPGGKKQLALRPEGTAGAVRAYVEHGLGMSDPVQRWWYFGPMFRHERQQKHRYRQFFQFGIEAFGVAAPEMDVEVLAIARDLLELLSLRGIELRLNSLGDGTCRPAYLAELAAYLRGRVDQLCPQCRDRLERNPLRVLDCKEPGCREVTKDAPASYAHLCAPCAEHFERVKAGATALGIPYRLDARLVRGLDYYGRTAFEVLADELGSGQQTAVCGGGRYDGLVKMLGGPDTPAIGFAMGVERLCALLEKQELPVRGPDLFLVFLDDAGRERALTLAAELRAAGLSVELDLRGGKLQRQLARADRRAARHALVLGSSELSSGRGKLKEMKGGAEVELALADLAAELRRRTENPA